MIWAQNKKKNQGASSRSARALGLALMSVLVSSAPFAHAEKNKAPGDSGVEEQLKFKAGDETGNEIKALKTELLVINSEKKALAQLQKLLKKHKGTRLEPDLLFRQAELYMRRARSERFFEVHRGSEQIVTFAPRLVKEASEASEIRKAISIYEQIQKRFPGFHSTDMVIFNTAYARQQLGEPKLAEAQYLRLLKEHPGSELLPDAYLAVGEICYQRRDFSLALDYFRSIRKYPNARAYPYGLYKAAWAYYNLQDTTSGVRQLEEVIKYGHEMVQARHDSKLDLRKEALGDLALFYGDVLPPNKAVDYFVKQARDMDAAPYILRLVEIYKRHSRSADIEVILKDFMSKMPKSEQIASIYDELIWNYERMKLQGKAAQQITAFDKYCEGRAPECPQKVADVSQKLATKWHSVWQKSYGQTGGDELSAGAETAYRVYLRSAQHESEVADLPQMRYSFAELLFARGQYREASAVYAEIERDKKVDAKVSHDAAYAAIVSLEKAVGTKWNDEDEKRFVTLSESYLKRFPSAPYVLDLRFKRAFIAYEKERYDEAATQFYKIGWSEARKVDSGAEKTAKAQDLYLDILNIKKDYRALKEAAQALLDKSSTQPIRVSQIEKIYREAYFAEIQQFEEKGDLPAAIAAYLKFASTNKDPDLAPKAWWNASQLQFKSGLAFEGADTCREMYRRFPQLSNSRDCLKRSVSIYESIGRLDKAADVLKDLAEIEPENAVKWKELAADFHALSGDQDIALQEYLQMAESSSTRARQEVLLEKAAQLASETGDKRVKQNIEAKFSQLGIEPQASRLVLEQAEEAFARGDLSKAFSLSKRLIGRDGLPKNILARARFVQAQVLEDEYRKQSVKARVERLGLVLAIKTEKLEKVQQAYQSAIRYADPETSVKSFRRLAGCYLDYSKTVRGLSAPGSAAEQQSFKEEIEQLAIPMEEKGIDSMNQALETARKAQLREGQIAELQDELNKLNMKSGPSRSRVSIETPAVYLPRLSGAEARAPAVSGVGL